MVKYWQFPLYYWVYYECRGRKELCTDLTFMVFQAIKRRIPSSFQRLSRAHEKGSQQIPVKTSLTYIHVIFPKLTSFKWRKKKEFFDLIFVIEWEFGSVYWRSWKSTCLNKKPFQHAAIVLRFSKRAIYICFRVLLSFSRSYPSIYCYHINNYKSPFFTFNVFV